MTPEKVAQAQLDAYNNHDIEAFLKCYAPDVEVRDFPSNSLVYRGQQEMRTRYLPLFAEGTIHARLLKRVAIGNIVIDEEDVTGLAAGSNVHAAAIYEVSEKMISRIWFIK